MSQRGPAVRRMQVCQSNRLAHRPDILNKLRQLGFVVEMEQCLDKCTRCEGCAFALVAGTYLFAPTPEAFVVSVTAGKDSGGRSGKG